MPRQCATYSSSNQRVRTTQSYQLFIPANHIGPVKQVYYPKCSPTKEFYDNCRCPDRGYGGLLSITFYTTEDAVLFFDEIKTAKGPSLGTNFTLSSPYTLLAHYGELEWVGYYATQYLSEADCVRLRNSASS